MISSFIKKLLFTNQFEIFKGRVRILDKSYSILPMEVLVGWEKESPKSCYTVLKEAAYNNTENILKKSGAKGQEALNLVIESFDGYGIGELEIVALEDKKAKVRLHNSPYILEAKRLKIQLHHSVTCGTIAGIFSRLFAHDVNAESEAEDESSCEMVVRS